MKIHPLGQGTWRYAQECILAHLRGDMWAGGKLGFNPTNDVDVAETPVSS